MPIRWAYLKRVLAGAIFGLYMAHLLYFLNPQVDVTQARLAAFTFIYGIICGLLFGSALWLLRIMRVRIFGSPAAEGTYRAHGFGFVVLAAFLASAIYWMHVLVFRRPQDQVGAIYLPIGAVRVLSKSANLITITAFALLALWVAERSANRRLSRVIFVAGVVLIAASSFFLYQGREHYRTETRNVVVADIGTVAGRRPVIVVAIRNLPYDWILTMAGEGELPFFEQARTQASFTRLEPFKTTSPKALWASLATGKLPYQHGVTGRFSYRTLFNGPDPTERFLILPSGIGFRIWGLIPPVKRISAQLPAGDSLPLWTLFERLSFRAAVVNWPSSIPSGASRVITDEYFQKPEARGVIPPQIEASVRRELRAPDSAVAQRFNGAGPARPRILEGLGHDLSAIAVVRDAATDREFELSVVALEGFSEAQRAIHIFANDLPPRSSLKGAALRAYAEQLDRMLGELARDFPDHLLIVVSPSAPSTPNIPANIFAITKAAILPEDPGADDGFMLIAGPGVTHRENLRTAYAVDLVPTVLFAAGLPVGRDMDGRVMNDAFAEDLRSNTLFIQTYEAKQIVVQRSGSR
ncbi:MAG TPA: alkaline phosphatase family protein [Thermoanaerobaculia bacterium]|nr:alkaline phosphatase family protein [Thermoanaerobaculia bacterium]